MFSEQFLSTETLSTPVAAILKTVGVCSFVFSQVRTSGKKLVADFALVRLDASVRDYVSF